MSEDINFEDNMKKLEQIANELEKGNLSLDESTKKFECLMKCLEKSNVCTAKTIC